MSSRKRVPDETTAAPAAKKSKVDSEEEKKLKVKGTAV